VIDGSIMPANPGVNPSLTITALAEYAMARVPEKKSIH
jgi:cholesterol oxidase